MQSTKLMVIEPCENFYKKNITFTSVSDVKRISEPLLKQIGITYFTFDRTYQDGSHIRLTTAGKWIETYYREKLYDTAIFEKNPRMFTNSHVFWSWLQREPIYSAASAHDIDHGLTIIEPHETYTDFFHFGTPCHKGVSQEKLSSEIKNLHFFIALFREKAKDFLEQAHRERFILHIKSLTHINLMDFKGKIFDSNILRRPEVTRLYLGDEFDNMYLTKKEIEVLDMLTSGTTSVDIANQLVLSEKTVESHVKRIKEKLKCNTLCELGFTVAKLNLQRVFPIKLNTNFAIGDKNGTMARYN